MEPVTPEDCIFPKREFIMGFGGFPEELVDRSAAPRERSEASEGEFDSILAAIPN